MELQIQHTPEFKKEYHGTQVDVPVQKSPLIPYVPKQDVNTERMAGVRNVLNARVVFPVERKQDNLSALWTALHNCRHGKRLQITFTNKQDRIKMTEWICSVVKDYNVHNFKTLHVVKLFKLNKWVGLGVK